jgi:hypothetical protein
MSTSQEARTVKPESDMWRVDVAGYPISVRGQHAHDHLEQINRENARMKLALHKLKWIDGEVGKVARMGLGMIQ